ncbi:hypothetical protein [Planomicrobium sp. CPCC 101079]|uniref:hypothetical protein n=1 Tax=Planomicrobium sp. CPCC 101079 TaxID=2599618 RepID=UPI0011B6AB0C|nr:hypothetical protein [Planomicrobium sp. CPCC 101079]TWT01794.1 hypothetical protein FQV28_14240 [Planomicrobium sp. CPCC 101079]
MKKGKFLFIVLTGLLVLAMCNFSKYPEGDYSELTYLEIKGESETDEWKSIKGKKQVNDIVGILQSSHWDKNVQEMSEAPEGMITLISEPDVEMERIYVWFDTTNQQTMLVAEGHGSGRLSKEEGAELKKKLTGN